MAIRDSVSNLSSKVTNFVRENPLVSIGGGVIGASVITAGVVGAVKRKSSSKKRKSKTKARGTRRLTKRQRLVRRIKKRKGRQSPYTAGARKDRSTRRIRHTKKGQPYVILRSGKARFIKKSSAKRSRKLKGGRY